MKFKVPEKQWVNEPVHFMWACIFVDLTVDHGHDLPSSEEHLMCAGTQDSMMQWINQLQQKRNNFNSQTVVDFTQSTVLLSGIQ